MSDKKKILDKYVNQDKKEDADQNFIGMEQAFENLKGDVNETVEDTQEFIAKRNQQRNLDREQGGVENQATKEEVQNSGEIADGQKAQEEQQKSEDDLWDDRSQEVDDMVVDVFNTTGMKSVVWKKKQERLKKKKQEKQGEIDNDMSMTQKVKQLRQEREDKDQGHWR